MDESGKIDPHIIKKHANVLIDEEILARIELLRKHSYTYRSILKYLNDFTNNMTSGVKFQRKEARTIYQLATGEMTWKIPILFHLSLSIDSSIILEKAKSPSMKATTFRILVNV